MKHVNNLVGAWLVLLVGAWIALPVVAQDQPFEYGMGLRAQVPYVAPGAITLDGVGDEAAWANARKIDPVANWDGAWSGHPDQDVAATAYLLHTEGMLYVYVEVEDYEVYTDAVEPWQSDQLLLGVDLDHTPGVTDVVNDGDFSGFASTAPDLVTYKIAHGIGVTVNWDPGAGDPVANGWVAGTTFLDETTLVWGAELAIVDPRITSGSEIGFNLGSAQSKAEGVNDRGGEYPYAWTSWVVCDANAVPEGVWCGPGGTVMSASYSFATVNLVSSTGTAVEPIPGEEIPSQFALEQNYPNPFNPSTTIEYAVPTAGVVTVGIYNALGQRVAGVVDQHQQAGRYRVTFDALDVPSGLYIYQLAVDGKVVSSKKMTLVK